MGDHQFVYLLLNGSKHCTVPRGAVYDEVCVAVRDRLNLSADTDITMTLPNGDEVQLGEDLVDGDRVSVNVGPRTGGDAAAVQPGHVDVGAGGRRVVGSVGATNGHRVVAASDRVGAAAGSDSAVPSSGGTRSTAVRGSSAVATASGAGAGAGAGAGVGGAVRVGAVRVGAASSSTWEFDENRPLSPTEKLSASKWLSAVASADTGLSSLRSAAGLKSIKADDVHLPRTFDRAGCPAAQPYLENIGVSFPILGHLLSSRTSSGVLSQVAQLCTAASNAVANQPNVEALRPLCHTTVVVLMGSRDSSGAVPNHPAVDQLGKQLRNILSYAKCYTDKGFLRKHLKGGEYKQRVDYFHAKARDALVSLTRDTYPDSNRQRTIDELQRGRNLGIGVLEELDVVVDRYKAERTNFVQAVSHDDAVAALEHRNFVVRDRGDGHVLDAPEGAHYVVFFKNGSDIASFGITNRALDEAWCVDQEFPVENGKLHVTKPSSGKFDSTRSSVYDRMDEILAIVAELDGVYTSDAAFLAAATAADE